MYAYEEEAEDLEDLAGITDWIKKIPGIVKKIKPEQVKKAGELVGAFKKGKKRGRQALAPAAAVSQESTPAAAGLGISSTWLLLGGAALVGTLLLLKK